MTDTSNVVSPWGYDFPERHVDENFVKALEDALEKARAGEVVGGTLILGYHDGLSSYRIAGRVASYSMLGAASMALRTLQEINNQSD